MLRRVHEIASVTLEEVCMVGLINVEVCLVGVDCKFYRIYNHLEDRPLNMLVRDYLYEVNGYKNTHMNSEWNLDFCMNFELHKRDTELGMHSIHPSLPSYCKYDVTSFFKLFLLGYALHNNELYTLELLDIYP